MADDLRGLFNPRAVAFVGVSPDLMKYAARALTSLRQRGFSGPIFAVNPKYRNVLGVPCVRDTRELPAGEIDLAFVAVSADRVPDVIAECGHRGSAPLSWRVPGSARVDLRGRPAKPPLFE